MNPTAKQLFEDAIRQTGLDLAAAPAEIATFASQRAAELAAMAGQPGIGEAAQAQADRVWMFAARRAVRSGDAIDAKAWGLIQGLLVGLAGAG